MSRIHSDAASTSAALSSKVSKLIIRNLVQDVLTVLFLPEWPMAETMLSVLTTFFVANLDNKTKPHLGSLHPLSVSVLGEIACHLKVHAIQAQLKPIVIRPKKDLVDVSANPMNNSEEEVDCVCGLKSHGVMSKDQNDNTSGIITTTLPAFNLDSICNIQA